MTDISFKKINNLAIPALIAGVAEPLLSSTDLAIVGNIDQNATQCTGAIGIVGAFLSMLVWVFGQTRSGISSVVSQYVGAKKEDEIKYLPAQVIFIVLITSLIVLLLTYPFCREIFQLYEAKGMILNFSVDYYKIRVFGFPFTLFTIAIFGTFRGLQNTFYPMIIAIIGTVLNIILDIVFVYGIEGVIPAMNLKGAALASVIAQIVMAIISAVLLLKKTHISLRFTFPFHYEIPKIITMILNLFVRTIALNLALFFSTRIATSYGDEYIAAYTVGFNIWLMGAFIIDGYSSAGNILSGKLLGEQNYEALLLLGKKLMRYGFVFGLILTSIGFLSYNLVGKIYLKEVTPRIVFEESFWIILVMQPFCSLAFIFDGMFKGLGETKLLRNVLLLATLLVFIPTVFLLNELNLKLYAIWFAFFLWIIARAIPMIVIFNKKFKTKKSQT